MRWSCLQFNVLLLPESYRRMPAETRGKQLSPPPTRPGRILENNIASRYVVRNQAETAQDAESTGEHHRIQQQAFFRFFPHFVVFDGFI